MSTMNVNFVNILPRRIEEEKLASVFPDNAMEVWFAELRAESHKRIFSHSSVSRHTLTWLASLSFPKGFTLH